MVDPITLGRNLWLIIGALILILLLLVLILSAWTGLNLGVWLLQRRAAERHFHDARGGSPDRRLPPMARGVCDRCDRAGDQVYHLPDGRRLCPGCFQSTQG